MPRISSPSPPPPAELPFVTGGFDFPQASASPPPAVPPPTARHRMNQLADYLAQHNHQDTADEDEDGDHDAARNRLSALRDVALHRRSTVRPTRVPRHAEREPQTAGARTGPARTGATPSERYLRRAFQQRVRDARSAMDDRSLSPPPLNAFHTSHRERSPPSASDYQSRQTKRRKLEHPAKQVSEHDGFKYGYKGQVVRGRLRMEVVSCDGGEFDRDSSLYRVQNVLSNDKSVYCSQSGSCNLLLKHIGDMPFCLEKMVIRAPDRGFTAPVQEGLVFVSMSSEKLLSGTSAYQIEYHPHDATTSPPPPIRSPLGADDDDFMTFEEALMDESVWERSRRILAERVSNMRPRNQVLRPTASSRAAREQRDEQLSTDEDDVANECPYHIDEGDSNAAGISAPTPPPFTTTMESEPEDSEESEAMPSAAVMADRLRRESRYRSEGEDDDEREEFIHHPITTIRRAEPLEPRLSSGRWRTTTHQHGSLDPIRATRLRTPSRIEPKNSRPQAENIIQPHARFFIARHKNKITIKFHPAISGKHVLLKLWSPTHDGNIDIESVQFYGYSGPRFFPAVQPR